jgi:hypothetical protein
MHGAAQGAADVPPQAPAARGRPRKLHLRCERGGRPLAFVLTAGERHEQTAFEPLMIAGAVKRPALVGRAAGRGLADRVTPLPSGA